MSDRNYSRRLSCESCGGRRANYSAQFCRSCTDGQKGEPCVMAVSPWQTLDHGVLMRTVAQRDIRGEGRRGG